MIEFSCYSSSCKVIWVVILLSDVIVETPFVFPFFLQMHSALMKSSGNYLEKTLKQ